MSLPKDMPTKIAGICGRISQLPQKETTLWFPVLQALLGTHGLDLASLAQRAREEAAGRGPGTGCSLSATWNRQGKAGGRVGNPALLLLFLFLFEAESGHALSWAAEGSAVPAKQSSLLPTLLLFCADS